MRVKENFQLIKRRSVIDKVGSSRRTSYYRFSNSSRTERERKGEGRRERVTSEGQNSPPGKLDARGGKKGRRIDHAIAGRAEIRSAVFAESLQFGRSTVRRRYGPRTGRARGSAVVELYPSRGPRRGAASHTSASLPPSHTLFFSPAVPSPPPPKLPISLRSIPLRFAFLLGFSRLARG